MSTQTDTIELDGNTYQVKQFGAKRADAILARLLIILGPALEKIDSEDEADLFRELTGAFAGLSRNLKVPDVEWIRDQMLEGTTWVRRGMDQNGNEIQIPTPLAQCYDTHFKGRTASRMKLIGFALKVNFSDFLAELDVKSLLGAALAKTPKGKRSSSPPGNLGSSGDSSTKTSDPE